MKKIFVLAGILLILALALAACAPADEDENPATTGIPASDEEALTTAEVPAMEPTDETGSNLGTAEPASTQPTDELGVKPEATAALATPNPETDSTLVPATPASGDPSTPQVRGVEVLPSTGRASVTQLSPFLNYTVLDSNGQAIGSVNDLILNLCEAHILYLVIDADPALNLNDGNRFLLPYEVASLGNGVIDVDQQTIQVNVDYQGLASAPALNETPDLSGNDWENDVRAFWSDQATLSNLSTACRVPAPASAETAVTPAATESPSSGMVTITKIAYASDVLGMQVQDGNGEPVGQVEEVILEPESGWLRFFIVSLDQSSPSGQGFVAVPIRAMNLDQPQGSDQPWLVLVVDRGVLDNAPGMDAAPQPDNNSWETPAMEYWGQHVPLVGGQP